MLLIEQIFEPNDIAIDYVKCLACKRGRLCDKPAGVHTPLREITSTGEIEQMFRLD